ncbi:MAG: hypothetical protein DRR42_17130 [Gammaproteobacteria bacterium]|nr:MAG: hypothetical protein DRR42_17130 [Gammaproteobacteria bacterium]
MGKEVIGSWLVLSVQVGWHLWPIYLFYTALMLVVQFILANGWRWLLETSVGPLAFQDALIPFAISNLGKYVPGKVLYMVSRVEFASKAGASRIEALSCFFLENVYLVVFATLVSVPAACSYFGISGTWAQLVIMTLGLTALVIFLRSNIFFFLLNKFLAINNKVPMETAQTRKLGARLIVNYISVWIIYGAAGAILASITFDVPNEQLVQIGSAFVASWLLGFLTIITPAGLGAREGALVVLLSPVIGPAESSILALFARLFWTIAELGLSASALIYPRPNTTQRPQ